MTAPRKKLKGIIFDMDGTIVDVPYDWSEIKAELETKGEPILSYLSKLPEPERALKWKILEKHEASATSQAELRDGMKEFFSFLQSEGIRTALVTNNSRKNVTALLNRFHLDFNVILTREDGWWKPSGTPFLIALERLGIQKRNCCVVGDSHFDILAAKAARIERIFIITERKDAFESAGVCVVETVGQLKELIEKHL